jgi:hypothetical protein
MKVYVLEGVWDWEGSEVLSVHATRELAEKAAGERLSKPEHDSYPVSEHELEGL